FRMYHTGPYGVNTYLCWDDATKKGFVIDPGGPSGRMEADIASEGITPEYIILTHGHADHANGISQWPAVYMNHRDIDLYYTRSDIELRKQMLRRTVPDIDTYPEEDFHAPFEGAFLELDDAVTFDLGDCTIRTILAPGHTQGMMVLLVPEDRTALFGDACGVSTFLFRDESSTVAEYCNTLKKLKQYENTYDRILRQHGTCESPKSLLDENLEVAEEILAGKDHHIPFEYMGFHVWMAEPVDPVTFQRTDGKSGNIVYADNKIR
ncbi:MAG: MBL fold metallo-hydrolase, partial [Solobacterium sp.]|nr:MBL fold metallo-hydrolase [Solobacterium sp.]